MNCLQQLGYPRSEIGISRPHPALMNMAKVRNGSEADVRSSLMLLPQNVRFRPEADLPKRSRQLARTAHWSVDRNTALRVYFTVGRNLTLNVPDGPYDEVCSPDDGTYTVPVLVV